MLQARRDVGARRSSSPLSETSVAPRPLPTPHPVFDTQDFAASERIEVYRDLYAIGADIEAMAPDFRARVEVSVYGALVLSRRSLHALGHARDEARIQRTAFDHFTLQLVYSGCVRIDSPTGSIELRAGESALMDMTRPFRTAAEGAELTTVSLPRWLVRDAAAHPPRLHGLKLDADAAAGLFVWLAGAEEDITRGVSGVAAEEALARALHGSLAPLLGHSRPTRREWDAIRRDRIREVIERQIDAADLSPERIASEAGMSRATLYRVFEPLGSIARWRQARRLWRLKSGLAWHDRPVADIAEEVGLSDPAYASALFNRAYGSTPTAFRRQFAASRHRAAFDSVRWVLDNVPVMLLAEPA